MCADVWMCECVQAGHKINGATNESGQRMLTTECDNDVVVDVIVHGNQTIVWFLLLLPLPMVFTNLENWNLTVPARQCHCEELKRVLIFSVSMMNASVCVCVWILENYLRVQTGARVRRWRDMVQTWRQNNSQWDFAETNQRAIQVLTQKTNKPTETTVRMMAKTRTRTRTRTRWRTLKKGRPWGKELIRIEYCKRIGEERRNREKRQVKETKVFWK